MKMRPKDKLVLAVLLVPVFAALCCGIFKVTDTCPPLFDCKGGDANALYVVNRRTEPINLRVGNPDPNRTTIIEVGAGRTGLVAELACQATAIEALESGRAVTLGWLDGPVCGEMTWTIPPDGPPVLTQGVPR